MAAEYNAYKFFLISSGAISCSSVMVVFSVKASEYFVKIDFLFEVVPYLLIEAI
jgi:hypothetical protein